MKIGTKRQERFKKSNTGYIQKNNPFPVTSCGRRRTLMMTNKPVKLFMKNKNTNYDI
tara:strand:- start:29 stop:199 length:171 start_codon:yes stop_codon:yes gene_type:complete